MPFGAHFTKNCFSSLEVYFLHVRVFFFNIAVHFFFCGQLGAGSGERNVLVAGITPRLPIRLALNHVNCALLRDNQGEKLADEQNCVDSFVERVMFKCSEQRQARVPRKTVDTIRICGYHLKPRILSLQIV